MLLVAFLPVILFLVLCVIVVAYFCSAREFETVHTVASSYDTWTSDGLLEYYWGEHIHLGHYGNPTRAKDFRAAKMDFTAEMAKWAGLDQLPRNTKVLDVGCGIGGSSRYLASTYGFHMHGVSISAAQIARARQLTTDRKCEFRLDDALKLSLPNESFEVVWCLEAGPHMPDKEAFAKELLRVLKPGGTLVVADWNVRDHQREPLSWLEKIILHQALRQWSHPPFVSIEEFSEILKRSGMAENVTTADWTVETLPSWNDSLLEVLRRPGGMFANPRMFLKASREIPTAFLMGLAFGRGLCRYGMFQAKKVEQPRGNGVGSDS